MVHRQAAPAHGERGGGRRPRPQARLQLPAHRLQPGGQQRAERGGGPRRGRHEGGLRRLAAGASLAMPPLARTEPAPSPHRAPLQSPHSKRLLHPSSPLPPLTLPVFLPVALPLAPQPQSPPFPSPRCVPPRAPPLSRRLVQPARPRYSSTGARPLATAKAASLGRSSTGLSLPLLLPNPNRYTLHLPLPHPNRYTTLILTLTRHPNS